MLHNPSTPNGSAPPPPERLPNFLLSGATSPGASGSQAPTTSAFPYPPLGRGNENVGRSHSFPYRSPGSANSPPPTSAPWPFPQRRFQGQPVAFNDRLRTGDGHNSQQKPPSGADQFGRPPINSFQPGKSPHMPAYGPSGMTPNGSATGTPMRTPSRMPPNKSLLDSGPPSVLNLRSPSASPATSMTPGSAARGAQTPSSMIPRTPVAGSPVGAGLERWVTVFGFSPAMESQLLREFRRHGEIVRTVAGRGNWIHILYRTNLQAEVALHKSWRLLTGTGTMVGVVPCTEPHVAREAEEQVERGILVASPSAASPFGGGTSNVPVMSPSPARNPALRTPSSILRREHGSSVGGTQNIVRTPQKQSGLLDYITGFYK